MATNAFDPNNADHVQAAKDLYSAMQGMVTSGNEAGAKALYNEKQGQFGFSDADVSPYFTGPTGSVYTPDQIASWKTLTTTTPTTTTPTTTTPTITAGDPQGFTPPTGLISGVAALSPTSTAYAPKMFETSGYTTTPMTSTGYTPTAPAAATGYTAQGYTPAQITGQESVSDAVNRIIKGDSPLTQTATTASQQAANSKGLINSSMAVQAGQQAVINSALPIAQGDVATSLAVKSANQDAINQALLFLADSQNTAEQFLAAAKNQNGLFTAEQSTAAAAYAAQAANVASQINSAAANTAAQFAAAAKNAANAGNANAFNEAMAQYKQAITGALGAEYTAQTQSAVLGSQQKQELAVQTLKGTQATAVANIEAQYKTLLQTSASATSLFNNSTTIMSNILADSTAAPEVKASQIQAQQNMLKSSLAVLSGISNLDLGALLDFGTTPATAGA